MHSLRLRPPRHAGQVPGVRDDPMTRATGNEILRRVERLGYAVSVHHTQIR
jgi:hypothetical protein